MESNMKIIFLMNTLACDVPYRAHYFRTHIHLALKEYIQRRRVNFGVLYGGMKQSAFPLTNTTFAQYFHKCVCGIVQISAQHSFSPIVVV